jgi:hypothetical protein
MLHGSARHKPNTAEYTVLCCFHERGGGIPGVLVPACEGAIRHPEAAEHVELLQLTADLTHLLTGGTIFHCAIHIF